MKKTIGYILVFAFAVINPYQSYAQLRGMPKKQWSMEIAKAFLASLPPIKKVSHQFRMAYFFFTTIDPLAVTPITSLSYASCTVAPILPKNQNVSLRTGTSLT